MAVIKFPELDPSSRRYTPGRMPETVFKAQNGASTFVQYGGIFVNAKQELKFQNLSDFDASQILTHYQSMKEDDYIEFTVSRGLGGIESSLRENMERGKGSDILRYRYDRPPSFESVYPGVTTVSCSFIGYLYGAG